MMRKLVLLTILLLPLVFMAIQVLPTTGAVPVNQTAVAVAPKRLIRLDPQSRQRYVPPPAAFLKNRNNLEQLATATIVVNFDGTGWTTEAQDAFRFAADIWETLITSSVPIVVDAKFSPLGPGILGGAGPTYVISDFTNAPQASTWYPIATANKLAGIDHNPAAADIHATFSRNYPNWYFGTDSSTPGGEINFVSVVLHELGHGLGFLGSMSVDNGTGGVECQGTAGEGCYGISGLPMIYDRLTENGTGTPLLDFPNNSTDLGTQLTSNNVFFNSPNANAANGGGPVPLYAPATWNPGSSYSHLAESYNPTPNALMTFSIGTGETIHNPGSVTLCMFKDMGWTVAESCTVTPISGLAAENDSPTVLGNATHLTATVTGGSDVTYEWDFGDGNGDTGSMVSHTYGAAGSYTATVTATNTISQDTTTTLVQVDSLIAGLAADNDGPTVLGNSTQLIGTISGGSNVTYEWDLGDGNYDTGAAVAHTYAAPGSYTATITATNSVGQDTATTLVQVDSLIAGLAADNDGPTLLSNTTQLTATISGGSNVSYEWDFGDGSGDTGPEVSHIYAAIGAYTATVTATNSVSQYVTTTVVEVQDVPIAGLTVENDSPTALGDTTLLTATITSGTNVSYEWNFGDGNGAAGAEVSHIYATSGEYTATVTATNSLDQQSTSTLVQIVDVPISGLMAENDSPTALGDTTLLTATITSGTNVSYEWDFGDGSGDTGAEVSHSYATVGEYTATVTATNSLGQRSTSTLVQIVDVPISGLAANNSSPTTLGDSTFLTATISTGTSVTFTWNFGDGSGDTGAEVSHSYGAIGEYTATVTATNSAGQQSITTLVNVVDVPIAGLAADNSSPTLLGDTTYLTATVTGGSNVSYLWDFGDGNGVTGAEVSHIYAFIGEYTATVTATNSAGQQSISTLVQIVDVPISGLAAENSSPTALGDSTFLTATISAGSNVTFTWDFGDGKGTTGAEVSHIYASIGEYTATVTATNSVGQQSISTLVQVVDVPISGLATENSSPTTMGETTFLTATIGAGSNVTFTWNFGDGSGNTGPEVSHTYGAIGEYTATVTATNSLGQQSTSTLVQIVDEPISGLAAENSSPTTLGETTFLTATISTGTNVTYTWDFGDGNGDTGPEVSHIYAAPGEYTAVVTATNSAGEQTTSTLVQILDVPINGLAAENDSPTTLGDTTQLTATITSGTNVTYLWDLGDGYQMSGSNVSHQYAAPGAYTATVTVTNSVGQAMAATLVQIVDIPISGLTATNDGPTLLGAITQLTTTVSSGSNVSYHWDLGDGNSANGPEISHQYAAAGFYTATVTAVNTAGQISAMTVVEVRIPNFSLYLPVILKP